LPAIRGEDQIFEERDAGDRALHRILEDPTDPLGSFIFGELGDIDPIKIMWPSSMLMNASDQIEQGGLARAIAADDADEIVIVDRQGKRLGGPFYRYRGCCRDGRSFSRLTHSSMFFGLLFIGFPTRPFLLSVASKYGIARTKTSKRAL
jgi:hypothetical protein